MKPFFYIKENSKPFLFSNYSPVQNKPFIFEEWKDVENSKYMVSNAGRVFDKNIGCIVEPSYLISSRINRIDACIYVKGNYNAIHRLVMILFAPIENMENLEVNHIDGNTLNNCIYNLCWCTNAENNRFAYMNGQMTYHDKDNNLVSKVILQPDVVDRICILIREGKNYVEISNLTGVSYQQIHSIHEGRTYREKYMQFKLYEIDKPKFRDFLTQEQLDEICKLLWQRKSHEDIANIIGCSKQTISSIKNGVLYPELYTKYNLAELKDRDTTRLAKEQKQSLVDFVNNNSKNYNSVNDLYRDALRYVGYDAPDKLSAALRQFVAYTTKYRKV